MNDRGHEDLKDGRPEKSAVCVCGGCLRGGIMVEASSTQPVAPVVFLEDHPHDLNRRAFYRNVDRFSGILSCQERQAVARLIKEERYDPQ